MEKKIRISKPDVNEIAFRVVQESTCDDNLGKSPKTKTPKSNSRTTPNK